MAIYEDVNRLQEAINEVLMGDDDGNINLDALDILLETKTATITSGLEKLCKIRANKEAEIVALKTEAKRIADKAASEAKHLDNLEKYMLSLFKRSGEKKLTAGTFTVGTRQSTAVVLADSFDDEKYMRTKTIVEPDKTAIKEALKNGVIIPGANLEIRENLSVR